jgi:hypothetical protein
LPPQLLELFVNCPIMLLKNMAGGLANGTRLIITKLMKNVIEAKVTSGPSKGELVCIPCLVFTPSIYLTEKSVSYLTSFCCDYQ